MRGSEFVNESSRSDGEDEPLGLVDEKEAGLIDLSGLSSVLSNLPSNGVLLGPRRVRPDLEGEGSRTGDRGGLRRLCGRMWIRTWFPHHRAWQAR